LGGTRDDDDEDEEDNGVFVRWVVRFFACAVGANATAEGRATAEKPRTMTPRTTNRPAVATAAVPPAAAAPEG